MQKALLGKALLLVMVVLMGAYFYINSRKIDFASYVYSSISQGEAADDVRLEINGKVIKSARLASSDIFDVTGKRQLGFVRLQSQQYAKLKGQIDQTGRADQASLVYQGDEYSLKGIGDGRVYFSETPKRKIYILNEDDREVLAQLLVTEYGKRQDVIGCLNQDACQNVRIQVAGWSGIEGPYLEEDLWSFRAGLPRGHWIYGKQAMVRVFARKGIRVRMKVDMLVLNNAQKISFQGPLASIRQVNGKNDTGYHGERYVPRSFLLDAVLQPGENRLMINSSLSRRLSRNQSQPVAAYVTGIQYKAM